MGLPTADDEQRPLDRRQQRRQDTINEIVDIAVHVMGADGVGALTVSAIARRLQVKPPSVYKYFPSLMAIYDAVFRRGQQANLAVLTDAVGTAHPGLPALRAGLEATGRWAIDNPVAAQLLFWRPVPGYIPTTDAFAPTVEIVALLRQQLQHAVDAGDLAPTATSDRAMALLSTLHFGIISQQLANEPEIGWDTGRYSTLFPDLFDMFTQKYAPQ